MSDKDKKYWLSLGHKHDTREYREELIEKLEKRQVKDGPSIPRRNFLGIMAASAALAGLSGCRRPVEKIVPYVRQPEEVIPGVPSHYATAMPFGTSAYGLVVESHEGRPTKIEGNKMHSSTLGSADVITQASILNMYDPDRSQKILNKGVEKTYDDFVAFWREQLDKYKANNGSGLAVISESFSSPTTARLKKDFEKEFPKAKWAAYEAISDENRDNALKQLSGDDIHPAYHYENAKIIVSFDADFLQTESENIIAARRFAESRKIEGTQDEMNRLYVVESQFTVTGSAADHRLRMRSSDIGQFVLALAKELEGRGMKLGDISGKALVEFDKKWLKAVADDLLSNRGESILIAGRKQPQWVHELVFLINQELGNFNKTIKFYDYIDAAASSLSALNDLVSSVNSGKIETLIILGGNPVYNGPADYNFADLIPKIEQTIHLSEYLDDTSKLATWHLHRSHYLERWGDVRSVEGVQSVVQPMIAPLYNSISDVELLSLIITGRDLRGYDIVRETWKKIIDGDFEKGWRKVLHDGLYDEEIRQASTPNLRASRMSEPEISNGSAVMSDKLEVVFYHTFLHDGRFANNGWLQELPDPISKLAWDNAALMSVRTANNLNLNNKDVIEIKANSKTITVPVWVVPGTADYSIGLALGYGRKGIGRVANDVGVDIFTIRTSNRQGYIKDVTISKTGQTYEMANTQDTNRMMGRPIYREATIEKYREEPEFASEMVEHPPLKSLFPDFDYSKGYQWGMVIDLNACIGCGACTVACQSENNIPIVGKKQVGNGREMHWMRIDRYFTGDDNDPEMVHMPVTCQHCENAPCESVCPVAATTHDKEGLNVMTYNRCIGTRYCSNNCPYKVRRFNFFNYTNSLPDTIKMAQNPDVTVRFRGVMEKCTFCVQRINRAKLNARKDGRTVADGEFESACQQACPTRAIRFGNINDPDSEVARLKNNDRNYVLLEELNVRPRNSYLAKIRNPHPDLEDSKA